MKIHEKILNNLAMQFIFEEEQCIGCAICADICKKNALTLGFQELFPIWNHSLCNGCLQCYQQCPTGAIKIILEKQKDLAH